MKKGTPIGARARAADESGGGEVSDKSVSARGPKIKAKDNPWYLLATIYGVPDLHDWKLHSKNRVAWNRYFAATLDKGTRTNLLEEKLYPAEELRPLSSEELQDIVRAFADRCREFGKELVLPEDSANINFSNVEFERAITFNNYLFSGYASFAGATGMADFQGATFSDLANFEGATFSGTSFHGATFSGPAFFHGATFSGLTRFDGATFSDWVDFKRVTFSGPAWFFGATFSGLTNRFDGATFSDLANFEGATFSGLSRFDGATFSDLANFEGATFSGQASFKAAHGKGTTFGKETRFVNSELKSETSFEGAKFLMEPPKFFNAKLHQGTVWRGIVWPTPKKADDAGAFIEGGRACLRGFLSCPPALRRVHHVVAETRL